MHYERRLDVVLPITRSRDGVWEQRAVYSQPDLHEELILDVDGPFASIASASVEVVRVVVCGDRNAGKSTLLHALVNPHDRDWLRLTSVLPVLAGVFVNARFGPAGSFLPRLTPPRDELPYLDTDVARTTLLLTREDFAYFADEFSLGLRPSTDYVALELVEIGGDHLDAMMTSSESRPPLLAATLERSIELVRGVSRFAYFVNCESLLRDGGAIDPSEWKRLCARLDWLRSASRDFESTTVFASRLPGGADPPMTDDDRAIFEAIERDDAGTPLTCRLATLLAPRGVVDARPARHVFESHSTASAVNVPGLASVLVALLRRHRSPSSISLVDQRLFACAAAATSRVEDGEFAPWIDSERFARDGPAGCCAAHIALAGFAEAARALCNRGALIEHARDCHAAIVVECDGFLLAPEALGLRREEEPPASLTPLPADSVVIFKGPTATRPDDAPFAVRAPLFPPLRRLLARCVQHRLLFSDDGGALPEALADDLRATTLQLDRALSEALSALSADALSAHRLLWLAEDRLLVDRIASPRKSERRRVRVALPRLPDTARAALAALDAQRQKRRHDLAPPGYPTTTDVDVLFFFTVAASSSL